MQKDKSNSVLLTRTLSTFENKNLQLNKVTFIGANQFKKSQQCFVCKIIFGQLKDRQHHCRLCGNSCCDLCSQRSINSQRVCDICFFKAQQLNQEKKRRKFIKSMKEHIDKMEQHIKAGKQKIYELENQYEKISQDQEQEKKQIENEYQDVHQQLLYQQCEKQRLEMELLGFGQQQKPKLELMDELQKKEAELDDQLSKLQTEIELKKQQLSEKKVHYEKLRQNLVEIEESDSFLNLSQYKEAIKMDPKNVGQQVVVINESRKQMMTNSQSRASKLYDSEMLQEEQKQHKVRTDRDNELEKGGCKENCLIF